MPSKTEQIKLDAERVEKELLTYTPGMQRKIIDMMEVVMREQPSIGEKDAMDLAIKRTKTTPFSLKDLITKTSPITGRNVAKVGADWVREQLKRHPPEMADKILRQCKAIGSAHPGLAVGVVYEAAVRTVQDGCAVIPIPEANGRMRFVGWRDNAARPWLCVNGHPNGSDLTRCSICMAWNPIAESAASEPEIDIPPGATVQRSADGSITSVTVDMKAIESRVLNAITEKLEQRMYDGPWKPEPTGEVVVGAAPPRAEPTGEVVASQRESLQRVPVPVVPVRSKNGDEVIVVDVNAMQKAFNKIEARSLSPAQAVREYTSLLATLLSAQIVIELEEERSPGLKRQRTQMVKDLIDQVERSIGNAKNNTGKKKNTPAVTVDEYGNRMMARSSKQVQSAKPKKPVKPVAPPRPESTNAGRRISFDDE